MSVYLCRYTGTQYLQYTVFCGYLPYLYLCACVFGKDSQQAYMLKVRTSAEKVLKKCGKSAEKVRIGAEKVRESAEKCESDPFSHTNYLLFQLS